MTSETTTVENQNLQPFKTGEERTILHATKGGSRSTRKKKIAAKLRELKKKYPFCQDDINHVLAVLSDVGKFIEISESELVELAVLKNEAIAKASKFEDKCKIQKDYISLLLEIGLIFYGKEKIVAHQEMIKQTEEEAVKIPISKRFELIKKYQELGLKEPPEIVISGKELIDGFKATMEAKYSE